MSDLSLADALSGAEIEEAIIDVPAGEVEQVEELPDAVAETVEGEDKTDEAKINDDSPPESEEQPNKEDWTKTAVIDERRKRQALEAELKQLKESQAESAGRPDALEDPEGSAKFLESQLQEIRLEAQQEILRETYEDYDEKVAAFIKAAEGNPLLVADIQNAANPAKRAYELAIKIEQMKELENPDAVREKIRAEEREKLEAEYAKRAETDQKGQNAIMPSLAGQRASTASGQEVVQDDDLETILKR